MASKTRKRKPQPDEAVTPLTGHVHEGIFPPFFPPAHIAQVHALVLQLQQSQWWSQERLLAHQLEQIRILAEHATATAPFYADRLEAITGLQPGKLTLEAFRQTPVLTRADIQAAGDQIFSRNPPPGHGKLRDIHTSGSTAQPVHVKTTVLAGTVNQARIRLPSKLDITTR